eukprot:gene14435-20442_t
MNAFQVKGKNPSLRPKLQTKKFAPSAPVLTRHVRLVVVTCVSAAATQTSKPAQQEEAEGSWLAKNPALARKLISLKHADEAAELMVDGEEGCNLNDGPCVSEEDSLALMNAALDKGNIQLALSIHEAMCRSNRYRGGGGRTSLDASTLAWPPANIRMTAGLALGLCRQLAITEAMQVVRDIKEQGLPSNDQIDFGVVVSSPLAPDSTLSVIQPREGSKLVCDAFSKYEYELFSGLVTTCSSEASAPSSSMLFSFASKVGLDWLVGGAPVGAVHSLTLQSPDGQSRTFRVATSDGNVPGQKGDRLTMVCAPFKNSAKGQRGLLSASPPDTKPGQAMTSTNHKTGAVIPLLPPPAPGSQAGIPNWVLPAVVLFAGGDAASSLLDPSLPLMIAGGMAFSVGSAVTGARVLVPKLKQLPDKAVSLEYSRQNKLATRVDNVVTESEEDVRVLAQLWQLQQKMESVNSSQSGSYEARIDRVAAARENIENRMSSRLELLDGYCRVMKMIEIEVEIDIEVPAAEMEGIEQQLNRLQELELLQEDWKYQAEARDEVSK